MTQDTPTVSGVSGVSPPSEASVPFAVGRGPCLTDTHRMIDGEPDAIWEWQSEASQCS